MGDGATLVLAGTETTRKARRLPLRLVVKRGEFRIKGGSFGKDGFAVFCCDQTLDAALSFTASAVAHVSFIGYGDTSAAAAEDLFGKVKAADIPPPLSKKAAAQKASNRRVRDTPTVATLDVSHEGVFVLCVDDVLTKNERYRLITVPCGKGKKRAAEKESDLAVAFKDAVKAAARRVLVPGPAIQSGAWSLEVLSVWPTERHHKCGLNTANGDADAPVSMVQDAMQHAGIIDNDMRIVSLTARSMYEKGQRRTVARLVRLDDRAEHDAAVASMLAAERQADSAVPC